MADPITLPKRYLTTAEACVVYNTTADYLKDQPLSALARNRRGHRTILYDVRDLEAHFGRCRESDGQPVPENVPALLYLPPSPKAA